MARAARARRITRLGLRARFTIAFAVGGLVLSALLAAVTYGLVRENIVRQRETSATRQVYLNARFIRDILRTAGANPTDVLDGLQTPVHHSVVDMVALDDALTRLAESDPRASRIVELKFFGGLSIEETAVGLWIGHATVERDCIMARAWLRQKLE